MDDICDWLARYPAVGLAAVVLVVAVLILLAGRLLATRINKEP